MSARTANLKDMESDKKSSFPYKECGKHYQALKQFAIKLE